MTGRGDERSAAAGRAGRWLFLLALGVYVATAGGSLTSTDAVVTFDEAVSIVEHHTVALSGNLTGNDALRGRDNRYYSPFGIVQSLYDIPFYLAGRTLAARAHLAAGKPDTIPKAFVAMGQTVVGAVIVWQIFRLSLAMTGDLAASLLAAVTFAFGSVLWPYARFGFNQPLACATLLAAVICAYVGVERSRDRWITAGGGWLAVSLMTRHEMVLGAVPLVAWLWLTGDVSYARRRARVAAFAPLLIAGVGAWLIFNSVRFGNPLDTGYLRDPVPEFRSPIVPGLLGLLFSPSASIFLYSPVVAFGAFGLARLARRDRSAAWLSASIVVLFLGFYATLGIWQAGRSYGSRYLVVVLPYLAVGWAALLSSSRPEVRRTLFAAVTVLGIVVQMPGVLVDYAKVSQAAAVAEGAFDMPARQWDWHASSLVLDAKAIRHAVPDNVAYLLGRKPRPAIAPPATGTDRGFSQQFAFSLDFWWLYLFYLGVLPRAAALAVPISGAAWTVWAARRLLSAAGS